MPTTVLTTPLVGRATLTSGTAPAIGQINVYDATSGNITATLPALSGLNVGSRMVLQKYQGDSSANTVTVSCAGSDTFVYPTSTNVMLRLTGELREITVVSIGGQKYWSHQAGWTPVAALDGRYVTPTGTQEIKNKTFDTTNTFPIAADYLDNGIQSIPRWSATAAGGTTSGTLYLSYTRSEKSFTAANIAAATFTTAAAASPTLCRMGLYSVASSGNLTLIASTPNDTSLFNTTNAIHTKAFSSSVSVSAGSTYALGLIVVSLATRPTFLSSVGTGSVNSQSPRRTGVVTSLSDLPSTINSGDIAAAGVAMYLTVTT